MTDQPTTDKLDMGVTADADIRYSNDQLPSRDETIRTNALSLAISTMPRPSDEIDREIVLATAARFEAWIRTGHRD